MEVVSYRVRLKVAAPKYAPREKPVAAAAPSSLPAVKGRREVWFDPDKATDATIYERDKLETGAQIAGPAIAEQFDATTVIPAGWSGRVDGFGNLILEKQG